MHNNSDLISYLITQDEVFSAAEIDELLEAVMESGNGLFWTLEHREDGDTIINPRPPDAIESRIDLLWRTWRLVIDGSLRKARS